MAVVCDQKTGIFSFHTTIAVDVNNDTHCSSVTMSIIINYQDYDTQFQYLSIFVVISCSSQSLSLSPSFLLPPPAIFFFEFKTVFVFLFFFRFRSLLENPEILKHMSIM